MSAIKIQENEHQVDTNKKIITVLQLTRFGDLIQTTQAVKLLKETHPEYEVHLIARKKFAAPLAFILTKTFDKVHQLDWDSLFLENNNNVSLDSIQRNLSKFIAMVNSFPISVAINLSYSKSSNYLMSLINSEHKVGTYYNEKNIIQVNDKWSQMLYATVLRGNLNPYSLIDLFTNIIGISKSKRPTPNYKSIKRNTIILHPFSSSSRKNWKPAKWSETIYKILNENPEVTIKIVGSAEEQKAGLEIINNPLLSRVSSRIQNLVGKTNIEELYQLFNKDTLFVGHDSMVGHLASLKNIQTLTLSLGTVRPNETTPYGENNYNISPKTNCFPCFPDTKCDYYQCHTDLPYQAVVNSVTSLLKFGTIEKSKIEKDCSSFFLSPIRIERTHYSNINFLQLSDILESDLDTKSIFRLYYRISWNYIFNEVEERNDYPKLNNTTRADLKFNMSGLQHLFELAEFGKKYARYILEEVASPSPRIDQIQDYSKRIDEIDSLTSLISETYPMLAPIIDYGKLANSNLFGENLVQLTESSFLIYNELSFLVSTLFDLSKKTLDEDAIKHTTKNENILKG